VKNAHYEGRLVVLFDDRYVRRDTYSIVKKQDRTSKLFVDDLARECILQGLIPFPCSDPGEAARLIASPEDDWNRPYPKPSAWVLDIEIPNLPGGKRKSRIRDGIDLAAQVRSHNGIGAERLDGKGNLSPVPVFFLTRFTPETRLSHDRADLWDRMHREVRSHWEFYQKGAGRTGDFFVLKHARRGAEPERVAMTEFARRIRQGACG